MRIALLSDVHSNLAALEAVLRHAAERQYDALWHMGDLVGYGPEPAAVIERMVAEGGSCVLGNHDAAVAGIIGTESFNDLAAEAARWTAEVISDSSVAYLAALPRVVVEDDFTRLHGTANDPLWEYLSTYDAARRHFASVGTRYSMVGHTHLPLVVTEQDSGEVGAAAPEDGQDVELLEARMCFNPGSTGQPRDGDPRASYALLDTTGQRVTFHRVEYDIPRTQSRMRALGLPRMLIERLASGH